MSEEWNLTVSLFGLVSFSMSRALTPSLCGKLLQVFVDKRM